MKINQEHKINRFINTHTDYGHISNKYLVLKLWGKNHNQLIKPIHIHHFDL